MTKRHDPRDEMTREAAVIPPSQIGWHLPAAWEHHSRCWMAWPSREATWQGAIEAARTATNEIARTIADFERVTMVCNPDDVVDVSLACGNGIQVLPLGLDDSWLQDSGPSFLVGDQGGVAGVHWQFDGWNGRSPDHGQDATLGRRILEHLGLPCFAAPLVLEGSALATDGAGTLLVTEQSLLGSGRNPGLDRPALEALLRAWTGASCVIWLGQGCQDDDSDGPVEDVACFVRPGVVLALTSDDPGDGNYRVLQDNLDRLNQARDARGRPLEVVPIRQPVRRNHNGRRLTLSYTNLYLANRAVILPSFEDAADAEAYRTLRRLFPRRDVIQIPALDLARGGGGIHSITQPQPAPLPLPFDPVI